MLLEEMRNRVHRGLGDRAKALPVPDIEAALNAVWQFQLPEIIPGLFREAVFTLTLRDGVDNYIIEDESELALVRSLGSDFFYDDGTFLKYYDNPRIFYATYAPDDVSESTKVTGVLYYGKGITFRPVPVVPPVHTIKIPGTSYQNVLTDQGVSNTNLAYIVVRGAVRDLAADLGYDDIMTRFSGLFDSSIRRAMGASHARPPGARQRRADF